MYPISRIPVVALAMIFALSAMHPSSTAWAEQGRIDIDYSACADQVGLVATDAMLSDVLRALATDLQFELHFKSDNDRPISVDLRKPASELIKVLGREDNIMITNEVDIHCDEPVDRITAIWFLGNGPEITFQPIRALRADQLPETGEAQTRGTSNSGADAQLEQDQKTHGKRQREMTPEERYYEMLQRRAAKGKP